MNPTARQAHALRTLQNTRPVDGKTFSFDFEAKYGRSFGNAGLYVSPSSPFELARISVPRELTKRITWFDIRSADSGTGLNTANFKLVAHFAGYLKDSEEFRIPIEYGVPIPEVASYLSAGNTYNSSTAIPVNPGGSIRRAIKNETLGTGVDTGSATTGFRFAPWKIDADIDRLELVVSYLFTTLNANGIDWCLGCLSQDQS